MPVVTFFDFTKSTNNTIENNYIGVNATGLEQLGNNSFGVRVFNADGLRVIDNVISGNSFDGIRFLAGSEADNSVIQGNYIGIAADGTTVIANGGSGIRFNSNDADNNLIGGHR